MNARERFFAALNGEPTDHVPVWLLFPYHKTNYYADVRTAPSYAEVVAASQRYAIALNRRNPAVRLFSPEVRAWSEKAVDGADRITRSFLEYKGKRLTAEVRNAKDGSTVQRLLRDEADLEFYCALPVNTDAAAVTAELDAHLPAYLAERAEFPAESGAMMLDLGEPIGPLYHASKLEEYATWSLTHSDLVVRFLDRVMAQKRLVYQYFLDRQLADVYFMVGSELASPPLVSPRTFRAWVLPYAAELIAMVHASGSAKVIQHYHGQIKEVLPGFLDMKADAVHTIEAPPVGNCTFTQAFDIVGDKITLIGNIQYEEFSALTPAQMADAVRAVIAECRGKRFILSPSAGPYAPAISRRVAENYLTFMRTAWEA